MTSDSKTDDSSPASWPLWQPPPGLPEPARQVWLAGLGALSRAQAEGGKAFESLVRQGLTLQTQASQMAQERIAEAAQAASQPWQHLSGLNSIFADRVAHALAHLGLPTAQDWAALHARVQALEAAWQDGWRTAPKTAPQPVTAKPAARPASAPVTPQRAARKPVTGAKVKPRASSGKKTRPSP